MINKGDLWSIAHVNHDIFKDSLDYTEMCFNSDIGWFKYLSETTPNGSLLKENVLYDAVGSDKVYLAHITKSFRSIQESRKMLSSSGCLVGSVYCTPVIQNGRKLRLHNLGEYILEKEAPKFSKDKKDVALLLVELEFPRERISPSVGIDYLKLGLVHFSVFSDLNYLLSHDELNELQQMTVHSVRKTSNLLSVIEDSSPELIAPKFREFYKLYQHAVCELPIFGYLLFETLCEYIALFQKGTEVERCFECGELYCANFKDMIFSVCPDLTRSFNLGLFHPDFESILKYLVKIGVIATKEDENAFTLHLARRLSYLVESRLYHPLHSDTPDRKTFWRNIEWDFEYLQQQLIPLLGHAIHRLLRNMRRYPNFYFYFDQYKALQAWNYWNHMDISLPYNAILPKGEIGINPADPYLKYKVFTADVNKEKGFTYLEKKKELPLAIEPRLAELNMLLMRKKS